jgi:hypothetical protein
MNTETQILSMSGDWSASCERRRSEQLQINGLLHQNEESFRDLFDEAPIAYVIGGRDWRIIQAKNVGNRKERLSDNNCYRAFRKDPQMCRSAKKTRHA